MMSAIFFDRDGVVNDSIDRPINNSLSGKTKKTAPWKYDEFKIKDGIAECLSGLKKKGFLVILISNQPDVVYGNLSIQDHNRIMSVIKDLPFDDIFICMHGRDDGCDCKKPKPGMLLWAANKYDINLKKSFFVGDTENDLLAARAAGCVFILYNTQKKYEIQSDFQVTNLKEIVTLVEEHQIDL